MYLVLNMVTAVCGYNLHNNVADSLLGNQRESKISLHWTVFLFPFHTTQSVRDKTADLNFIQPDKKSKERQPGIEFELNQCSDREQLKQLSIR